MSDTAPRNPVSAPQMLADALLRSVGGTTALLARDGNQHGYKHFGSRTGGDDICRSSGKSGSHAQIAAQRGKKAGNRNGS